MEKTYHVKGDFLNTNYSSAVIWSKLALEEYDFDKDHKIIGWPRGELKITDCNKQVDLDLNFETAEEFAQSLHKLDTIIYHCINLRTEFGKIRIEYLKLKAEEDELKKKKNDKTSENID